MDPGETAAGLAGGDRNARPVHTRTYQACIPCRKRKVKCDLGEVDNPQDPPCRRCRREGKECYFSSTRRKRKGEDGDDVDSVTPDATEYDARNSRKKLRTNSLGLYPPLSSDGLDSPSFANSHAHLTLDQGVLANRPPPPPPPHSSDTGPSAVSDEEDQKVSQKAAAVLQHAEMFSGHDALNLLYEASRANGDLKHDGAESKATPRSAVHGGTNGTGVPSPQARRSTAGLSVSTMSAQQRMDQPSATVEPTANPNPTSAPFESAEDEESGRDQAMEAWSRFRFVRAGWFTPTEAIEYVNYFYKYLSPLTPITVPNFQSPMTHHRLLSEEPMLTVTILTIASRYVSFSGPGGMSRPYAIHERLWKYLQGMIERMMWGQEQFGGGFCGAGARAIGGEQPTTRKGLRTLGTIESLLLLTEWHTRALHFPPGEDNDELMLLEAEPGKERAGSSRATPSMEPGQGTAGRRIDSWLEPCWRSDSMTWSLLANATALAFELQIFTRGPEDEKLTAAAAAAVGLDKADSSTRVLNRRRTNVKRLLFIYMELTSGRLCLQSMLPATDPKLYVGDNPLIAAGLMGSDNKLIRTARRAMDDSLRAIELQQDVVLYFWGGMASFFQWGNTEVFPSDEHTRELISTGKYEAKVHQSRDSLHRWLAEFNECRDFIPQHMRHIMMIEYQYAVVYLYNIAMQAVVHRCINSSASQKYSSSKTDSTQRSGEPVLLPGQLIQYLGRDQQYMRECIESCRSTLEIITNGLRPGDYLKHAPVRTYFRTISVCMVLLKTFAFGTSIDDAAISFQSIHHATEAMRTCVVDDVHVGSHIAAMLAITATRVKSHLVRMAAHADANNNNNRNPNHTSNPSSNITSHAHSSGAQRPLATSPNAPTHPTPQLTTASPLIHPLSPFFTRGGHAIYNSPSQDSLYGLPSEFYDSSNPNFSIMPPPWTTFTDPFASATTTPAPLPTKSPGSNNGLLSPQGAPDVSGMHRQQHMRFPDWVALPLDPLLDNYGADVTQTGYGPDVGGNDMLEVLFNTTGGGQDYDGMN